MNTREIGTNRKKREERGDKVFFDGINGIVRMKRENADEEGSK
jgi:hypothetical protein